MLHRTDERIQLGLRWIETHGRTLVRQVHVGAVGVFVDHLPNALDVSLDRGESPVELMLVLHAALLRGLHYTLPQGEGYLTWLPHDRLGIRRPYPLRKGCAGYSRSSCSRS